MAEPSIEQSDPSAKSKNGSRKLKVVCILMALVGVALIVWFVGFGGSLPKKNTGVTPAFVSPPQTQTQTQNTQSGLYYPVGFLFTTQERDAYIDGQLQIEIPRLEYSGPVLDGISDAVLYKGLGLYDHATTPGWAQKSFADNYNISIAGHRDLYGCEFYAIDTFTQGDEIYVEQSGIRYTFTYLDTTVVDPDDWSAVFCTDQPMLTLTSCDPIGIANKRIVVRATLTNTETAA